MARDALQTLGQDGYQLPARASPEPRRGRPARRRHRRTGAVNARRPAAPSMQHQPRDPAGGRERRDEHCSPERERAVGLRSRHDRRACPAEREPPCGAIRSRARRGRPRSSTHESERRQAGRGDRETDARCAPATAAPRRTARRAQTEQQPARPATVAARARRLEINSTADGDAVARRRARVARDRRGHRPRRDSGQVGIGQFEKFGEGGAFIACRRRVVARADSAPAAGRAPSCRGGSATRACRPRHSVLALEHHLLDLGDGLRRDSGPSGRPRCSS